MQISFPWLIPDTAICQLNSIMRPINAVHPSNIFAFFHHFGDSITWTFVSLSELLVDKVKVYDDVCIYKLSTSGSSIATLY